MASRGISPPLARPIKAWARATADCPPAHQVHRADVAGESRLGRGADCTLARARARARRRALHEHDPQVHGGRRPADTRQVIHVAVTSSPTLAWVKQQIRDMTPWGQCPRFLLHDNDGISGQRRRRPGEQKQRDVKRYHCRVSRRNTGVRHGRPAHNGPNNLASYRPIVFSRRTGNTRSRRCLALSPRPLDLSMRRMIGSSRNRCGSCSRPASCRGG
jgi:hypothetical protein